MEDVLFLWYTVDVLHVLQISWSVSPSLVRTEGLVWRASDNILANVLMVGRVPGAI